MVDTRKEQYWVKPKFLPGSHKNCKILSAFVIFWPFSFTKWNAKEPINPKTMVIANAKKFPPLKKKNWQLRSEIINPQSAKDWEKEEATRNKMQLDFKSGL